MKTLRIIVMYDCMINGIPICRRFVFSGLALFETTTQEVNFFLSARFFVVQKWVSHCGKKVSLGLRFAQNIHFWGVTDALCFTENEILSTFHERFLWKVVFLLQQIAVVLDAFGSCPCLSVSLVSLAVSEYCHSQTRSTIESLEWYYSVAWVIEISSESNSVQTRQKSFGWDYKPSVYHVHMSHTKRSHTHFKALVVHVRIRWIMEAPKQHSMH